MKDKKYGSSEIGQRIESFRKEEQMSQEELAKELSEMLGYKISRETVAHWENGIRAINSTHIVAIAELFQKTTDEILFGVKPENRDIYGYTGLAEDTIEELHDFIINPEEGRNLARIINKLVENKEIYDLTDYLISKWPDKMEAQRRSYEN